VRILVVEDEKDLAHIIRRGLTEEGYAVDLAYDGEEGESFAEGAPYDLIVLDIVLPKKDGFEVCANLRRKKVNTRILMLTSKDSVGDRVRGLDTGADDYLVKPFSYDELSARIRALLRREVTNGSPVIQVGDIAINTATREVRRGDKTVELNHKEYSILEYLMHNANIVISRPMIEDHVWNLTLDSESNLIDVYIRRLRKKLDGPDEASLIETVRGAGYRLRAA
jgi:DNA-binding response OmpR family regulator